jgi:hypothetical protein
LSGDTNDDPDGDGLSNLAEYVLGRDPTASGDDKKMELVVNGSEIHILTPVRKDIDSSVSYSYQVRDDLIFGSWSNVSFGTIGTDESDAVINLMTNSTPTIENKKFIRMLIEKE